MLLLQCVMFDVPALRRGREDEARLQLTGRLPAILQNGADIVRQGQPAPRRGRLSRSDQKIPAAIFGKADVGPFQPMAFVRPQTGLIEYDRHIGKQW